MARPPAAGGFFLLPGANRSSASLHTSLELLPLTAWAAFTYYQKTISPVEWGSPMPRRQ